NTEYLFPYLIISAYKRQKTYPKNLPNIIGLEAGATAAEAVNIGDVSTHFLSKYEERWLGVMGEQLLYQEKLFLDTVGKALEVKDEKIRHELYEKRLLEAIVGYTQWIIEWILKRKEKAKKD
ncbi:MAG: hypothetical protein KIH08_12310, partial [Candidatus Freyarchaeota archaeon]|nr:hypothetical protein [Candidatus Jordarchaeia archaeon]